MEPPGDTEGRSFVEVMSEKYSPENFPYRRGTGLGIVVVPTAGPQGSPMKGEGEANNNDFSSSSYSFSLCRRSLCKIYPVKFQPNLAVTLHDFADK